MSASSASSAPALSPQLQELLAQNKIRLIDKPLGRSSHFMVNQIRTETGEQRVGHAGTLDPLATGLLLILVTREATKVQDQLMGLDKVYEFTAELGYETDTYDSGGRLTQSSPWKEVALITHQKLEAVLDTFVGEYDQQVPAYSAVKLHGQKLYEKALRHQAVELPSRRVKIYSLELVSFQKDERNQKISFSCKVHCGSGTYMRSLVVDIGRALGVGATVTVLRRTRIGMFSLPIH